jgi:peptide/nickel transport system substrate-binding protein
VLKVRFAAVKASVCTLALAAAAGVVIAACGGATAETTNSGGGSSTLTLFESSPPTSLDPAQAQAPTDVQFADLGYGSLFYYVSPGRYESDLAESFTYVGMGNREVQIVLRPNVKFADGTLLTSQVEEATIKFGIKKGGLSQAQFPLSHMTTPNSRTLDIYFSTPYPYAEFEFSQQGGFSAPISMKGMQTSEIGYKTFGAGPYVLDSSATTAGSVYTYVRNTTYFDPAQQKWAKVVVKVIGNANSAVQAASTTSDSYVAGSVVENSAAKAAGLKVNPVVPSKSYGMLITDRRGQLVPALGNVKVRQALNYAVDRTSAAQALNGLPNEQLIDPGFVGHYTPNIYSYDVSKAKQLLSEAGYPHGFTFTALVNGSDATSVDAAQLLVPEFQKIGVTLKLVSAPTFGAFLTGLATQKYGADVDQLPGNTLSFFQSTLFPGGSFDFFKDPAPTSNFQSEFNAASALDGAAAETAWATLNRTAEEYGWLVELAAVAPSYYSSHGLSVPDSYGVTPDPEYFAKT